MNRAALGPAKNQIRTTPKIAIKIFTNICFSSIRIIYKNLRKDIQNEQKKGGACLLFNEKFTLATTESATL